MPRGRRIRVMYVTNDLMLGGAQRYQVALCQGIDRRRFEVSVECVAAGGPLVEDLRRLGVPVGMTRCIGRWGKARWIRPGGIMALACRMRRRRVDIAHTSLFLGNTVGRLAALLAGVPVVIATEHNVYDWKRALHKVADRALARRTDRMVAVSDTVRRFTLRQERLLPQRFVTIHNGIEVAPFDHPRPRAAVRAALGLPAEAPVIIGVGHLIERKGFGLMLPVMERLRLRLPGAVLVIAGDGPLREALAAEVERRRLIDCVRLLGARRDVPDLLAMSDLLVLPSSREGFGLVLVEAMAARRPVAVSRRIAPIAGELFDDPSMCLLCDFEDSKGTAEALRQVLCSPARAAAMGGYGRRMVERKFTLAAMVRAYEALYEDLLAGRARADG